MQAVELPLFRAAKWLGSYPKSKTAILQFHP